MGLFKRPIKQKNGKIKLFWYGRIRQHGKLRLKSFGPVGEITRAMAEAMFVEWRRQRTSGSKFHDPTLREFADSYIRFKRDAEKRKAWQRDTYSIKHFLEFFGPDIKLSGISIKAIDDYKLHRLQFVSRSTVKRELECLRRMLFLAKKWNQFQGENPVSAAGLWRLKNQRKRTLSLEEQSKLLPAIPPHARRIIELILKTGMRPGEAVFLKKFSVYLDKQLIRLLAEHTKENEYKDIPLTQSAITILKEAMSLSNSEYVFTNARGRPFKSVGAVRRILNRVCKKVGIHDLTLHDLRHTWATRALEGKGGKKANIVAVKEILGHSDLRTTMRYVHPGESLREAVEIVEDYEKDV